jgi:hypothetical protein
MNKKSKVTWTYDDGEAVDCGVATVVKMWLPVLFKQRKKKMQCVVYASTRKDYNYICKEFDDESEPFFMDTTVKLVSQKKFDRLALKHNNHAFDEASKKVI